MSLTPNTHLASEFYVLMCLHRVGYEAYLTLGNAKKIDITVINSKQDRLTIDVKGMASKGQWRIPNLVSDENHFIVFVSFLGKLSDTSIRPEIYIVPSDKVNEITHTCQPSNMPVVRLAKLRDCKSRYFEKWSLLE